MITAFFPVFLADSWGPWQQWSLCSVRCGEGVRERVRGCLLPSGVGGMKCTGMVKEQSICSLEDCAGQYSLQPRSICQEFYYDTYDLFVFFPSVAAIISVFTHHTCRNGSPRW